MIKKILFVLLFSLLAFGCATNNLTGANTATDPVESVVQLPTNAVYVLDSSSKLLWESSRLVATPHQGGISVSEGNLLRTNSQFVTGSFVIDMDSITINDGKQKVVSHLKNEDFFNVAKYPTSKLAIKQITPTGNEIYQVTGDLTILDKTNSITFPAKLKGSDRMLRVLAVFEIDRTKWGITYDSGTFFSEVGDRAIKDEIKFGLNLLFKEQVGEDNIPVADIDSKADSNSPADMGSPEVTNTKEGGDSKVDTDIKADVDIKADADNKADSTLKAVNVANLAYNELGAPDAPVTFIEYSDYQCPFCKKFTTKTLPLIKEKYVDTGKVKFVFKDFPLEIHKEAKLDAVAAHCAGEQGKYFEMHDLLFETIEFTSENFILLGEQLRLDAESFAVCLEDASMLQRVESNIKEAKALGISGTPSFSINGVVVSGAQPFGVFEQIIDPKVKVEKVSDAACNSDADCSGANSFPAYCSKQGDSCVTSASQKCSLPGTAQSECVVIINEECEGCSNGCAEGVCS